MTTDRDRPTPPALDSEARDALDTLEDRDADQLRAIGEYLEDLAAWTNTTENGEATTASATTEADTTDGADDDGTSDNASSDDTEPEYPDGVPERASVTIKEIAGTTYSYYQWRDGDRIESKTVQRE